MRTRSAGDRALIQAARLEHHLWVEVENKDRTFIDLSTWVESAEWGDSIDQPTGTFTLHFRRDTQTDSLAPTIGASTLNRDNAGAYAPMLQAGRNVKIWTAVVAPGTDPLTAKKLAFWGRVDRVRWNSTPIEVTGRDLGGWIVDAFIQQERIIGSATPTAIETLMTQVLANDPVYGTPTIFTPTSPGFLVANPTGARQAKKSIMEALQQDYALSLGWACRYVFDNGTDTPRLTFFDIDRTKTVADDEFAPGEYEDITGLEVSDAEVRNYIVGTYYDAAGKQHSRTVQNATSQGQYGVKFMQIDLAIGDPIDTDAEMDAMLNAAVSDLGAPLTTQEMLTLYYWPVQLGDLYNFKANTDHYDSDQKLAVVSFSHKFENGQGKTTMQCRGSVVGAYHAWFRRGTDGGADTSDLPQITQVSVAFPAGVATVDVLLRGNVVVGSWRVALSTVAQPDLATTRAAPVYTGQNVEALITQAVYTGQKLYISVLAYSGVTGSGSESDFFQSSTTRDGVGGAIMPVPDIELVYTDFIEFEMKFRGTWSAGAPLPHEWRWGFGTNTSTTISWNAWTDKAFLPFDTGMINRADKSATVVFLEVRQGSDDATIQRESMEMAGIDPSTGNDGLIVRSQPFNDGGFALKATDLNGFIITPSGQESGLKAVNLLLAKPLASSPDNLNSVGDGSTRAAVAPGTIDLNNAPLLIAIPDTRSVAHAPTYYNKNVRGQFKDSAVIGIPGGVSGQYTQVLGWRGWSDDSGNGAGELAVPPDGRLYYRYGTTGGGWNAWGELARKSEVLSLSAGGTVTGNIIVVGGALVSRLDGQAIASSAQSLNAALYWAWYASDQATRRGYIGFGAGTTAGLPLYVNSDTGPVYIQTPGGVVATFGASGLATSLGGALTVTGTIQSTSTYGLAIGDIASVARLRYGAVVAGWIDFINSANGFAGLIAYGLKFSTGGPQFETVDVGQTCYRGGNGFPSISFRTSDGTLRGYLYADSSGFGLLSSGGNWVVQVPFGTTDLVNPTGDIKLSSSGKQFKDSFGNGMLPGIVSTLAASGTAADKTLWIQV